MFCFVSQSMCYILFVLFDKVSCIKKSIKKVLSYPLLILTEKFKRYHFVPDFQIL